MRFLLMACLFCCCASQSAMAQDIDCSNAMSQVEMTFCAGKDLDAADAELNRVYRLAMEAARIQDEVLEADQIPSRTMLRDAQRAWIEFRDRACEAESTLFRGGTAQSQLYLTCKTRLTESRTKDLEFFAQPR